MTRDRWYNPLMRWLLRSPLHGLVSRNILIITFTGRKSGKQFSVPINYREQGLLIELISNKSRSWWHNIEGGAPVTLRLRGRDLPATAYVAKVGHAEIMRALGAVYGGISAERAASLVDTSVLIQVHLAETQNMLAQQPARLHSAG